MRAAEHFAPRANMGHCHRVEVDSPRVAFLQIVQEASAGPAQQFTGHDRAVGYFKSVGARDSGSFAFGPGVLRAVDQTDGLRGHHPLGEGFTLTPDGRQKFRQRVCCGWPLVRKRCAAAPIVVVDFAANIRLRILLRAGQRQQRFAIAEGQQAALQQFRSQLLPRIPQRLVVVGVLLRARGPAKLKRPSFLLRALRSFSGSQVVARFINLQASAHAFGAAGAGAEGFTRAASF